MASGSLEFKFDVKGIKELDKVLSQLPRGTSRTILRQTIKKSLRPVVKDARAFLRASDWDSAGAAKSIKSKTIKGSRVPAALALGPSGDWWYAKFFEGGFRSRRAEPFLRPAWNKNKDNLTKDFSKSMWFVLNRLSKRLVKQAYAGKLSGSARKVLGI